MSKEKWTDGRTRGFILSYINQPALWNVSNADYTSKVKKVEAYNALQTEFGLSQNEVKNKIRIYRTTYGQELKKMEANSDFEPKLIWFNDLHRAFNGGKIKSFTKSYTKNSPKKPKLDVQSVKIFEYTDDSAEVQYENESEIQYEVKCINKEGKGEHTYETYEEEIEEEVYLEQPSESPTHKTQNQITLTAASSSKNTSNCFESAMGSNELFLKSLLSTLDRLPDDKNMRARIKIQEILYNITYEPDK